MIPQVLFFAFLTLVTAVGLWKDLTAASLSLALAWNTTNAAILGAFIVTAFREKRATAQTLADDDAAPVPIAVSLLPDDAAHDEAPTEPTAERTPPTADARSIHQEVSA
jgi:cellulose synthase (UDP-forming)